MSPLDGMDLHGPNKTLQAGRPVRATDVERQTATARELLRRLGGGRPVQLLADEVGMGKTYVALAVASALRPAGSPCRVAVLVPNLVLAEKWVREVREFNGTCVTNQNLTLRPAEPGGTYMVDDLADLSSTAPGRQLAIVRYGSHGLASKRLADAGERMAAAAWALSLDPKLASHKQALRGAFAARSKSQVDGGFADAVKHLKLDARPLLPVPLPAGKDGPSAPQLEGRSGRQLWDEAVGAVLAAPKTPYVALRNAVQPHLLFLARAALLAQVKPFDLVVVDEAHNWVNRANGANAARLAFLHRARHALLLTATPLQLNARDLPSLLGQFADLGAALHAKPPALLTGDVGVISERLARASEAATRFRVAWGALRPDAHVAVTPGAVVVDDERAQSAIAELDKANRRLEQELRPWLIRHRRSRAHRRVLVGEELTVGNLGPRPPEIRVLRAPAPRRCGCRWCRR